jgi:FtsH-binding integral membrane protein
MSDFNRGYARPMSAGAADMSVDAGLRGFMLGVYNKVALGLLISAALAWLTADFAPVQQLLYVVADGRLVGFTPLGMAVRFAPFALILAMLFMRNPSPRSAGVLYWSTVAIFGAGAGVWLLAYTGMSVATTFLITAASFGGLSLVGYTTKRDLTGFGSFLMMGLFGLVLAMIVGFFFHSPALYFAINVIGVLIFAGLIAYDTQRLKMTYYQLGGDQASMSVATSYGALSLYLDFINLFQFLMSLMGNRR